MSDQFTFIDLFAGVGGFHAALANLGGRCVYVAEKDPFAQAVYREAWLSGGKDDPHVTGDINKDVPVDTGHTIAELLARAEAGRIKLENVPEEFDVLAAGFPCQTFSKSGKQEGILDTVRGTLFYNILVIIAMRKPKVVFLENVKNLVGPSHRTTTFKTIVDSLTDLGYVVNPDPTIFSPHTIAPEHGGGPQSRERVYILAVRKELVANDAPFIGPKRSNGWSADEWRIDRTQLPDRGQMPAVVTDAWVDTIRHEDPALAERANEVRSAYMPDLVQYRLTDDDKWLRVYELLLANVVKGRKKNQRGSWFPGHPIWFDADREEWRKREHADAVAHRKAERARDWKDEFLKKSAEFIEAYSKQLTGRGSGDILKKILALPNNAWRKLEWQASDAESLDDCLIQLRPSGVRVKKATYAPALVAINQTPILGSERRRITPYEAGRLQGFPDMVFQAMMTTEQPATQSYKQFGNAVHVGAVRFALVHFVCHHFGTEALPDAPDLGSLAPLVEHCRSTKKRWLPEAPPADPAPPVAEIPGTVTSLTDNTAPVRRRQRAVLAVH
ncbi:DNA (cytosine-5-)-methyltransferase [Antribacter sp. KLBMP9083]|uniref:Cytosine-specific methyltransferase n=1 Tax=Antribacter soli TaxID=2910976 RepID=A0AA41QFB2_9MICO|nr:DNA (cytosine-5-)-methyltransferase [Antribacter soli]MCF4122078.1 DNA (cytosine-5-)-methyltransferase [Antribacter soli]